MGSNSRLKREAKDPATPAERLRVLAVLYTGHSTFKLHKLVATNPNIPYDTLMQLFWHYAGKTVEMGDTTYHEMLVTVFDNPSWSLFLLEDPARQEQRDRLQDNLYRLERSLTSEEAITEATDPRGAILRQSIYKKRPYPPLRNYGPSPSFAKEPS